MKKKKVLSFLAKLYAKKLSASTNFKLPFDSWTLTNQKKKKFAAVQTIHKYSQKCKQSSVGLWSQNC